MGDDGVCITGNEGKGVKVITVVLIVGSPGHELTSEQAKVYVVVPVGLAVTTVPVVDTKPPDAGADHVYELDAIPPVAVKVTVCGPHTIDGLTVAVIVGDPAQDNPFTSKNTPESNDPSATSQTPIVIVYC